MNKKRTTRKKHTSYKIPFKSKILTEVDSKIAVEQKRTFSKDVSYDKEQKATIPNRKVIKRQNPMKQSKSKKITDHDNHFTYKNDNIDSYVSREFSGTSVNKEARKLNVQFKYDETKVENSFGNTVSNLLVKSNGHISSEENKYDEMKVDINFLLTEIVNNVCKNKLVTFQSRRFEKDLNKEKYDSQEEELSSPIKNHSCSSTVEDKESKNENIKTLKDNLSNGNKDKEKKLGDSNDKELIKANYHSNNNSTELTDTKTEDKDNLKRKIEHEQGEVKELVGADKKYKKQKMANIGFYLESKTVNEHDNSLLSEKLDCVDVNRNENMNILEFQKDDPFVLANFTSKEKLTISDINSSNKESNTPLTLNSQKRDEIIPLPEITNQATQFQENFTDLNSNIITMSTSRNGQALVKNVLTIPCMTALDYFRTSEFTETINSTETDDNSNLFSLSQGSQHSNREGLPTGCGTEFQDELNKTEFLKNGNSTKHEKNNQTEHKIFRKTTTCHEEGNQTGTNSNFSPLPQTETNYNTYNANPHYPGSSKTTNIVSGVIDFTTQFNKVIGSTMFNDEEFIAEKIIFREKDENDDNDVIPTGVFKHLNEIFEYNNETTSIGLKCTSPTRFLSEEQVIDTRKGDDYNDKIGLREPIETQDFIKQIKNKSPKANNSELNKNADLSLNKNEKEIHTWNSKNTEQVHDDNTKSYSSEESIKLNEGKEVIKFEGKEKGDGRNEIQFLEESSITLKQNEANEIKYFTDFDNCMEMDDDFDLTASQLCLLDADEKMQSNKRDVEQQTDASGPINNDPLILEIINELRSLKESIEGLKEKVG